MPSPCFHPDTLERFAEGTLAPDAAGSVLNHLGQCAKCEEAMDTIQRDSNSRDPLIARFRRVVKELPFQAEVESAGVVNQVRRHLSDDGFRSNGISDLQFDVPLPEHLRDYQLLENLGDGGMGVVYRARHTRLDRIVALKLIRPDRLQNKSARERFAREMKAAGQLEHPNVVRALDAGESSGQHYLAMEFVDGVTLAELVAKKGPRPVEDCCQIIAGAAAGLQHIHEARLVHRDIKPSNIMLCRVAVTGGEKSTVDEEYSPGNVKILDLGLTLLAEDISDDLTSHDQIMGTYDYIAPEQARRSHQVDIRADIYSLGCTFYFLLTGRPPFPNGSAAEKLIDHQMDLPTPVTQYRDDVPRDVEAVIGRMMSKSPDERFATPNEVAAALNTPDFPSVAKAAVRKEHINRRTPQESASRKGMWMVLGLLSALGLAYLLVSTITIGTPRGEVVVELADGVDPGDLRMEVIGNGQIHIADADNNWKIKIEEGSYRARLLGDADELLLQPNRIRVLRDKTQRVSVQLRPPPSKPHVREFVSPERRIANWVLSVGGKVACYDAKDKLILTVEDLPPEPLEIHTIDLTGAGWTNRDLQQLDALPNLDRLILGRSRATIGVEDSESARLPATPVQIDAGTIEILADLPTLRVLRCNDVGLDDESLTQFASAHQLRLLTVSNSPNVSAQAIERLSQSLPDCRILSELDGALSDQEIENAESDLRPIDHDRRVARWVISLRGDVCINDDEENEIVEMNQLPQAPFRVTTMDLRSCRISTSELRRLDGLEKLWRLYLGANWGSVLLDANTIDVLAQCELPVLSKLYLYNVPIDDAGLINLKRLDRINELSLNSAAITDSGLKSLSQLPGLRHLYLDRTQVTGAGFVHLAKQDIQTLFLVETPLSETDFLAMPDWPNLETLRVDGTPLTDPAIRSLARYPTLKDLGLNLLTNCTHAAWSVLEHLPELTRVRFRVNNNCVDDRIFPHLAHCTKLEHLDLEICPITDAGLQLLDNRALKYLDVRHCQRLTDEGIEKLRQRMTECRILWTTDNVLSKPSTPTPK